MAFLLRSGGASDTGPHRANNEDGGLTSSTVALVADGVGGGPAGELAAALLVHHLAPSSARVPSGEAVRELVRVSNWDLGWYARRDPSAQGMASTLTGLFATRDGLALVHVGDSRAYRLRGDEAQQMTKDDSFVQQLVDAGLIDEATAATHPRRNIVTATLRGDDGDGVAVIDVADTRAGDRWVLCSDGISDYVPRDDLIDRVRSGTPEEAAARLVATAVDAGTRDNATAVVCDIVEADDEESPRPGVRFLGAAAEHFAEDDENADDEAAGIA